MQIQIGKTKIEATGGFMYIQAFGREVFVKRDGKVEWKPQVRRDSRTSAKEIWALGFYIVM